MTKTRLGGLSAAEFLRRHWQREPLLAREALPGLGEFLRRDRLFELAARDDLESRLVIRDAHAWRVRHGPFPARALSRIRDSRWSLLVQGVERVLPAARQVLERFAFIPHARFDDVMVSYAPPGGGVGPHFDSYDVFLAQASGTRRWRIGPLRDASLLPGAPLRILRRFRPERELLARPGDLLYLPPRYGHDGVAVTDCITWSIGFRAPRARELTAGFLEYLQERVAGEGIYEDPGLRAPRHPAELAAPMVREAARMLRAIRWGRDDVADFLGRHLTEAAAQVVFQRPARPLSAAAFAPAVARRGLRLALATRMLFQGGTVFVNGEACHMGPRLPPGVARLADRRAAAPGTRFDRGALGRLYEWYRAGYIVLGHEATE
jgi:50S ribosomal protein L16 3-hydroxylase